MIDSTAPYIQYVTNGTVAHHREVGPQVLSSLFEELSAAHDYSQTPQKHFCVEHRGGVLLQNLTGASQFLRTSRRTDPRDAPFLILHSSVLSCTGSSTPVWGLPSRYSSVFGGPAAQELFDLKCVFPFLGPVGLILVIYLIVIMLK